MNRVQCRTCEVWVHHDYAMKEWRLWSDESWTCPDCDAARDRARFGVSGDLLAGLPEAPPDEHIGERPFAEYATVRQLVSRIRDLQRQMMRDTMALQLGQDINVLRTLQQMTLWDYGNPELIDLIDYAAECAGLPAIRRGNDLLPRGSLPTPSPRSDPGTDPAPG